MRMVSALLGLVIWATPVLADSFAIADIVVDNAVARATPPSPMTGGAYLTITNNGDSSDRLIAVEADFPRVEIHTTELIDDVARMVRLEGVEIPAGETVVLAPGGLHVMFMGLNGEPLEEGETVPATLVFENAGRLDIVFEVTKIEAGHGSHGAHDGKPSDSHDHN